MFVNVEKYIRVVRNYSNMLKYINAFLRIISHTNQFKNNDSILFININGNK